MKVAIVYDWIDKWGGVERVLLTLHEMFPEAPFYTSYYDEKGAFWAKGLQIKTSFIQKLPSFIKKSRVASFPFYPYAFESFDFSEFDVVISVTSSFAKSVVTKPSTAHICYLLTPTRYVWVSPDMYFKNNIIKKLLEPYLTRLMKWDFIAAQRPDKIISISKTVQKRCREYYQRESEVIYPPFDIEHWRKIKDQTSQPKAKKKFFLVVSRLEPYKKVDLVIQLFNRLGGEVIVVGAGSQERQLQRFAKKNIVFMPHISDEELGRLYSEAEALIMPQEEDFGYVSLEAQYFGCPVIAYARGGSLDTVRERQTGIFFQSQTENGLAEALERYRAIAYNLKHSTRKWGDKNTEQFSKAIFKKRLSEFI